jgi:hypothetical protein
MMLLAIVASALAAPATVGIAAEYDVVGHNYGVRGEVVLGGGVHGLRLALGVLPSRENLFLPVSAGWRARTGPDATVHARFGAGLEAQTFLFSDRPPRLRSSFYGELGAAWSVSDGVDVGALVVPELAPFGIPGFGLGLRAGAWL